VNLPFAELSAVAVKKMDDAGFIVLSIIGVALDIAFIAIL
jgi:hypothetical protein